MKLFRWRSEALKGYRSGDILAIGVDADAARTAIRASLGEMYQRHKLYLEDNEAGWLLHITDEDDMERWLEWRDRVEADIATNPTCDPVVFITGVD